ncbi:MAG: di-heme oxidoredictase family protein, partial [Actinomycetota bacterium]
MKQINVRAALAAGVLALPGVLVAAGAQAVPGRRGNDRRDQGSGPRGGGPTPVNDRLGGPVAGLDDATRALFLAGKSEFEDVKTIEDGLGPVFNGRSCAECHGAPVTGGAGGDLQRTQAVRIGKWTNGVFDELVSVGGSLLQRRSIRELDRGFPLDGERIPAEANVASVRASPPVFGAGLMEAIPAATILAAADPNDANRDGVSGKPNMVFNPESGQMEVGRFGWKSVVPSVSVFAAGAMNFELGITNPLLSTEQLPQGQPIPAGWDRAADPEDGGQGVQLLTTYMRYLAPPPRPALNSTARRGEALFVTTGCATCHTPSLTTGGSDPLLANKAAFLYYDLLLHDMGDRLADH